MYNLSQKTILIISQQSWGKMFVSKHHYALELAKRGNIVYYLNPPNYLHRDFKEKVEIVTSGIHENLFLITNNLSFPYNIKFHFIGLFHFFMRGHIKQIVRKISRPLDIIWSFDLAYVYPLYLFPKAAVKIFHPVDYPLNSTGVMAATGAQYILSTAEEILEKYSAYHVPKHFINHGIANEFVTTKKTGNPGDKIRIGFSGNLIREDIDRSVLLNIIKENPDFVFECWGSYAIKDTNIGGATDNATIDFIANLKSLNNVILHGVVPTTELAAALQGMDAFLICYDLTIENRNGPNYHKIMEYISTGKIIIANYISVYKDLPQFVQMVHDPLNNRELPVLFKQVTGALGSYNTQALQNERVQFALSNTYDRQVDRIEKILASA